MELIVDDPHVFVGIVRAHLDLVWAPAAGRIKELVELRPGLNHLAVAIDDEDDVMVAAFPSALLDGLARCSLPIVIARCLSGRIQHAVCRPWLGAFRKRQLSALRDPDAIRRFCKNGTGGSPRPAFMLDAVRTIGQRLRPVLDKLVRAELVLSAAFGSGVGRF
jgi:hypothetical protein